MNNIPYDRLQDGMLCYVTNKEHYYQWSNNGWSKFIISTDIKRVDNVEDLKNIDTSELLEGVLCYVKSKGKYYVWNLVEWNPLITDINDGLDDDIKLYIVQTEDEMKGLSIQYTISEGALCYVKDIGIYYKFGSDKIWTTFNQSETYYIGQEVIIDTKEPTSKTALWVDTSDMYTHDLNSLVDNVIIKEILNSVQTLRNNFQKEIYALKSEVNELRSIIENGDFVVGSKDCLLTESGDFFMTEDGDLFLLESAEEVQAKNALLTENGEAFITEDGKDTFTTE